MFNKRGLFVPAAVIFSAFLGVSAANAQNSACLYTLASLQGTYAVIGSYAGNIALASGSGNFRWTGQSHANLHNERARGRVGDWSQNYHPDYEHGNLHSE